MSKNAQMKKLDVKNLRIHELRQKCNVVARSTDIAEKIWKQVLNESQRQAAGKTFAEAAQKFTGVDFWIKAYGGSSLRAAFEIAKRFHIITETDLHDLLEDAGEPPAVDETDADYEQIVNSIVPSMLLVVLDDPPEVFFEGKQIEIDSWRNRRALWTYWWLLCRSCRLGVTLDGSSFNAKAGRSYLAGQKSRLKWMDGFPTKLTQLIKPTGGRTQTLDFKRDEIRVFEAVAGRYREVLSRRKM
jgi:hypothetical protein